MYGRGSKATLRDVYGCLARVLNNELVPVPLRKEAAALLLDTGWASMLGVEDAALALLDTSASASQAANLYDESADLMLDNRV